MPIILFWVIKFIDFNYMMPEIRRSIAFFIESFSGGGAERVLLTILRHIDLEKYDVTVVVMSDTGVYSRAFHSLKVRIVNVMGRNGGLFSKVKYKLLYNLLPPPIVCRWILRGIKAETLVAFVEGYCTKVFAYAPAGVRKVAWVHIDLDTFPWPVQKGIFSGFEQERKVYSKFNAVIGVSQNVVDVMQVKYGIKHASLLYNPIDEDRIAALATEHCRVKTEPSAFNVVSIGRLTRQKGYDLLIAQMPAMLASNPNIRLYIIGEGEDRPALEWQIHELGLENKVKLLGFLDNPYNLLKKMDLFVCSSRAEGFSLVIAEAMICGLPVLSMECSGPNELLGDGRYGILCKTHNQLAEEIVRISKDSFSLSTLRDKAKERAVDFNTAKTIQQIENIL